MESKILKRHLRKAGLRPIKVSKTGGGMSQCCGTTIKGLQCKRICKTGKYCYSHLNLEVPEIPVQLPECCVCLDSKLCEMTDCGHKICEECLYTWSLGKNFEAACPMCRTGLGEKLQEPVKQTAVKRGDAVEMFEINLHITQAFYNSLSFQVPYKEWLTLDQIDFLIRELSNVDEGISSKITKKRAIKKLDKTCNCSSCKDINVNKKVYYLKTPDWYNDDDTDIILSIMRALDLNRYQRGDAL
jgi:hypothetical protein